MKMIIMIMTYYVFYYHYRHVIYVNSNKQIQNENFQFIQSMIKISIRGQI